ncbi:hypothetical protein [Pseudomonas sp. RA_5y_Pfl1_P24]|uniref:hypothetical protein n=1 Tax=Pseudomonas sp. RA_5y_Pfl1_P24 TaxID=3088706 RepID=UPI0030D83222
MSEVKRWKLKGFLPGVEGECKAAFQPTVVMAEDFDNATRLFLDAAERCVASERREKELQRRLTAAYERADARHPGRPEDGHSARSEETRSA